ncbi:hypothetical protein Pelo_19749 [Pelomyxa schiedti]|nr:hypothetical protein Pelo_19749 [Pelomyxa schiedti]
MWRNILPPENNKTNNGCKRSQLRIAFEDLPSFDEIVCGSCPLQMIVKLIVSKKFGVEPTQQVLFTGGSENNNSEELLPTDSSMTLDDIQQRQQQQISGSGSSSSSRNRSVVQIKLFPHLESEPMELFSSAPSMMITTR